MIKLNTKIILASGSPRRKALLKNIGLKFTTVKSPNVNEQLRSSIFEHKKSSDIAILIAYGKADSVSRNVKGNTIIIAADTIVVMNDRIIGKPSDKKDAHRILKLLSKKTHKVITGVCLLKMPEHRAHNFYVCTNVTMLDMTDKDIQWYIGTEEPMDKAGAYGIQGLGGLFVKKIEGSYTNVVGLPLSELVLNLKALEAIDLSA